MPDWLWLISGVILGHLLTIISILIYDKIFKI